MNHLLCSYVWRRPNWWSPRSRGRTTRPQTYLSENFPWLQNHTNASNGNTCVYNIMLRFSLLLKLHQIEEVRGFSNLESLFTENTLPTTCAEPNRGRPSWCFPDVVRPSLRPSPHYISVLSHTINLPRTPNICTDSGPPMYWLLGGLIRGAPDPPNPPYGGGGGAKICLYFWGGYY